MEPMVRQGKESEDGDPQITQITQKEKEQVSRKGAKIKKI